MVGVILAIVGAMIIPRLAGSSRTTGQLAVEQVTEALATFAFRDSMTSQQVALMRDGETGHLEVWVKDVDQDHPDAPPDWRPDRFMRSIALPEGRDELDPLARERGDLGLARVAHEDSRARSRMREHRLHDQATELSCPTDDHDQLLVLHGAQAAARVAP